MHTQLTTKGQLVIPKAIRQALELIPGTKFEAKIVDGAILLKPTINRTELPNQWAGRNPANKSLSSDELCAPVDLP